MFLYKTTSSSSKGKQKAHEDAGVPSEKRKMAMYRKCLEKDTEAMDGFLILLICLHVERLYNTLLRYESDINYFSFNGQSTFMQYIWLDFCFPIHC